MSTGDSICLCVCAWVCAHMCLCVYAEGKVKLVSTSGNKIGNLSACTEKSLLPIARWSASLLVSLCSTQPCASAHLGFMESQSHMGPN